jgi:1,4-dihydroxy-2-naphthoate octaprenyltransferase
MKPYLTHLRLPFQFLLSPIFLWGYLIAGGTLNATLLIAYLAFHLFLYAGGTALNSYYDRDEGPVGGLAHPPPPPKYLLAFSLAWQGIGFVFALAVNVWVAAIYFVMFWMSVAYSHPRVRLKGKPFGALATIMLGQGILPFYGGWAAARGNLQGANEWFAILAALSATLIIGGMYPLTQIYQLDADAQRGDLTSARFLGVKNSFRLALVSIAVGGAGAVFIAATNPSTLLGTRFSWWEAAGLALFLAAFLYAVAQWRKKFFAQTVMQNFKTVMRLYAGVTLPFLAWILFRLMFATIP